MVNVKNDQVIIDRIKHLEESEKAFLSFLWDKSVISGYDYQITTYIGRITGHEILDDELHEILRRQAYCRTLSYLMDHDENGCYLKVEREVGYESIEKILGYKPNLLYRRNM